MGNTSSTGKDKKTGLPNQAARGIQAEPINPLKIPEIANKVAQVVLAKTSSHTVKDDQTGEYIEKSEKIKKQEEKDVSQFAITSTLFRDSTQGPRIAHKCALLASQGEEEKIKQLFNISPVNIGYM